MAAADDSGWRLPGWAHHSGALAMGSGVAGIDPGDARLVTERVARYCWAYDERRADLLSECFTDDGVWEGNVLGKVPVGPFTGRTQILKWLSEFWPHQHDQRRHMLLNNLVESLDADRAVTLSYLLLMSSDGQAPRLECTGFYRCELAREGQVWRIARMSAGFDAPFWPGQLETMSARGKRRHGVLEKDTE